VPPRRPSHEWAKMSVPSPSDSSGAARTSTVHPGSVQDVKAHGGALDRRMRLRVALWSVLLHPVYCFFVLALAVLVCFIRPITWPISGTGDKNHSVVPWVLFATASMTFVGFSGVAFHLDAWPLYRSVGERGATLRRMGRIEIIMGCLWPLLSLLNLVEYVMWAARFDARHPHVRASLPLEVSRGAEILSSSNTMITRW